jgi:RNA polymerase sigma-70 factor, ECF subfamily
MTDIELLALAKRNNQKAFTILYNKYYQVIYNIIYNLVKNEEIAHDLCNESFLKAFKQLDKYVKNLSFIAWLKVIASNHTIDWLRANKTGQLSNIDDFINILSDRNDPSTILMNKEKGQEILDIIEDLPLKYQEIVDLKYNKGLSNLEISKKLNCSVNSVKSYITRIKSKLRSKTNKLCQTT